MVTKKEIDYKIVEYCWYQISFATGVVTYVSIRLSEAFFEVKVLVLPKASPALLNHWILLNPMAVICTFVNISSKKGRKISNLLQSFPLVFLQTPRFLMTLVTNLFLLRPERFWIKYYFLISRSTSLQLPSRRHGSSKRWTNGSGQIRRIRFLATGE